MITPSHFVASDWPTPLPIRILPGRASARAAAYSLRRAGCAPFASDPFGDQDFLAVCPAPPPDAFDLPWIYLGGLENEPDRIDSLANRAPLLGISGGPLRAARDPNRIGEVVRGAGFPFPETRSHPQGVPTDGRWLIKPRASAGGLGVRRWRGGPFDSAHHAHHFQRWIEGEPLSAIFVADRNSASCRLQGVTRQWLRDCDEGEFVYEGGIAPWPVSARARDRIERLGAALAQGLGLFGLFGVDLQLADDEPWTIEINPRHTAAVELLEWSSGRSLGAEHLRTFGVQAQRAGVIEDESRPAFVAKRVIWADRPCRWTGQWRPSPSLWDVPDLADVPQNDAIIPRGAPVLTVVSQGESVAECLRRLAIREEQVRGSLNSLNKT